MNAHEPTPSTHKSPAHLAGIATPKIPDHELLRPIGSGSYGEVWLARNIMGTYRAIKIVYRQRFEDVRPFDREFNGVKNFEPISRMHEGFVDILQLGRNDDEGYFYSVMELADPRDGSMEVNPHTYEPKTVGAIIARGEPLPYEECLTFGLAVSSALAFLHKRRLVHRDIKPSNLIIVNGLPKLADVGMVTDAGSASIAGGTIGYLPPESVPGVQADVFAFGKVLYELATGLDRLKHPSLPDFWTDAPNLPQLTELNEIVLKACEPDPTRRYASGEELHGDLLLLRTGESVKRLFWLERLVRLSRKAVVALIGLGLLVGWEFYRVSRERERESRRLADIHVAAGALRASRGDFLGALPWYAEALELDRKRPERAARHMMNLQTAIRYSPRIVRMFFEEANIYDVAFSPDGHQIAEAIGDDHNGRVVVRQFEKPDSFYELSGHRGKVRSVCWSPNGDHLLSASADGTARVWSSETRAVVKVLEHPGELLDAKFNFAGDLVVAAGDSGLGKETNGLVRIWRWKNRELVAERLETALVRSAVFNTDSSSLALASEDGFARLLENPSLKSRLAHFWHPPKAGASNWVFDLSFSVDGKYLATGGLDGARVWDLSSLQLLSLFPHDAPVNAVSFSPDQRYLLTASDDYTARIWDLQRSIEAFPPLRHDSVVRGAAFSSDGRLVATATSGGVVTIWDLAPEEWKPLGPAIYSPDGSYLAQFGTNSIQVFNAETEKAVAEPIRVSGKTRDLSFTRDGKRLLLVYEAPAGQISPLHARLYSLDGKPLGVELSLTNFVPESSDHSIASLSTDGYRVAVVLGSAVQLWDAEHGRLLGPITHHSSEARAVVSPDGSRIVTCSERQVFLFDGLTGRLIKALPHPEYADCAAFSPNSRILVTGCRDNGELPRGAYIWDARNGDQTGPTLQHQDGVSQVTFSPDGKFLLTAGEDRVVIEWRVDKWEEVRRFEYDHSFNSAAFNRDGTRVVTTAGDDTVRIWDAQAEGRIGIALTPPLKHLYNLWDARFVGDGKRVLAKRLMLDRWTRADEMAGDTNQTHLPGRRTPQDWEKTMWLIDEKNYEIDDLRTMAELLSAQRIVFDHTAGLDRFNLRELWRKINHKRFPRFDFLPGEIVAWHHEQLERALQQHDSTAALFHQNRLTRLTASEGN
jgi:WD40 repeat protein